MFISKQEDPIHGVALLAAAKKYDVDLGVKIDPTVLSPAYSLYFLAGLKIGVLSEDEMGLLNFYSRGAERIFGYSPKEILGTLSINLAPEHLREGREALFERVKKEGVVKGIETQRINKTGNLIEIVADVFLYELGNVPCIAAAVRTK